MITLFPATGGHSSHVMYVHHSSSSKHADRGRGCLRATGKPSPCQRYSRSSLSRIGARQISAPTLQNISFLSLIAADLSHPPPPQPSLVIQACNSPSSLAITWRSFSEPPWQCLSRTPGLHPCKRPKTSARTMPAI